MGDHTSQAECGRDLKRPAGENQIEQFSAHVGLISVNVADVNEVQATFLFQPRIIGSQGHNIAVCSD